MRLSPNKHIITNTYKYNDQYLIDIVENYIDHEFSAWIYDKSYGVKSLMFGCPLEQQPLDEFIDLVAANVKDYLLGYIEEYTD